MVAHRWGRMLATDPNSDSKASPTSQNVEGFFCCLLFPLTKRPFFWDKRKQWVEPTVMHTLIFKSLNSLLGEVSFLHLTPSIHCVMHKLILKSMRSSAEKNTRACISFSPPVPLLAEFQKNILASLKCGFDLLEFITVTDQSPRSCRLFFRIEATAHQELLGAAVLITLSWLQSVGTLYKEVAAPGSFSCVFWRVNTISWLSGFWVLGSVLSAVLLGWRDA